MKYEYFPTLIAYALLIDRLIKFPKLSANITAQINKQISDYAKNEIPWTFQMIGKKWVWEEGRRE